MEYFTTSNSIPMHISDTQKGDFTLLFLHGYLETLNVWEDFISTLNQVSDISFRYVCIDLPGHGLSGSHKEANTMEFCADVIKNLLDKAYINQCSIIGHSLGGYIGLKCLQKYPDTFNSLSLFNSNPYPDAADVYKGRSKEISFILEGRLPALATLVIPNMFFKDNLRRMDDNIQMILSNCDTHDPAGIAASVRGIMEREDMSPFLSTTKNVLSVFGDNDYYFPIDMVNKMIDEFPDMAHEIIKNTGHNSFLEDAKTVASLLLTFLKKVLLP